jgi:hypothetical protein
MGRHIMKTTIEIADDLFERAEQWEVFANPKLEGRSTVAHTVGFQRERRLNRQPQMFAARS